MKDTFSLPNIRKGVVITKWKELTLFLPSEIKTFPSKDFSPFTVEFLGNKIDHGELPHNIFQENILNSALGVMLKTIENLPVCPGIYDPALVDMAERKRETNLYFGDAKGANVDGEIVKCIRSLNCTYKLPVHSKTRCNKHQDSLRSCFMFFVTLDEPTESEKHAMQTKSYISDAFDYSHEFQMVKTQDLWEYREFDRSLMPKAGNNHDRLEQVRRFILRKWFSRTNNILYHVILQLEKPISLKETIVFGWSFRKVYHSYHVVLFLTGRPQWLLQKA